MTEREEPLDRLQAPASRRGSGDEVVTATFTLPARELEALKLLARRRDLGVVQALRQAIATELFIQRLVDEAAKLLVQRADGTLQQIVFAQAQSGTSRSASASALPEDHGPATRRSE